MKLFAAMLISGTLALLSAQSPKVELLTYQTASFCDGGGNDCLTMSSEVRMLRIIAPRAGATAYQIQIITPDRDGARRTWQYVIQRQERRYGDFKTATSATFFAIPIDLDIPILDIWVTALIPAGEPDHQQPTLRR